MEIYPAVDLYQEKVVRLERGDYEKRVTYSEDPRATAKRWADQGARWLHVVDLEGARFGELKNEGALEKILAEKKVSVQFGGGVRRREVIEKLLQWGVRRVVIGTRALDPSFLQEITGVYGDHVALSLDLRGEQLQVEGWLKTTGQSVFDAFHQLENYRLSCVIVTDIDRDGTLEGINLAKMRRILEASPFPVICSGGIGSLSDLRALISLQSPRLAGVIIGKSLYEGRIDLVEAIRLIKRETA